MKRLFLLLVLALICTAGCSVIINGNSTPSISTEGDTTSVTKTDTSETTSDEKEDPGIETGQNPNREPAALPSDEEKMISQFKSLGFTDEEAQDMQKIFENVGVTKINNISKFIQGNGIDGEQGFYCNFYCFDVKRDSIRLDFKIVKRKLQIIAISWARGENYPDIDKYNDLVLCDDVKESDYGSYVYLYYKKLKNCEVVEDYSGYRAVYDYNTHSVGKYN